MEKKDRISQFMYQERMTDKDQFKVITKNRPIVSKIEGDLYYFDWPELQLEEYFKRFGRDAIVIEPASLKEKIKKFYYYGLREYSK